MPSRCGAGDLGHRLERAGGLPREAVPRVMWVSRLGNKVVHTGKIMQEMYLQGEELFSSEELS